MLANQRWFNYLEKEQIFVSSHKQLYLSKLSFGFALVGKKSLTAEDNILSFPWWEDRMVSIPEVVDGLG